MSRKRRTVTTDKNPVKLPMDSEWTFEKLALFDKEIARIAKDHLRLDTYPNQIEVITSEQMMDAYSSVGMPVGYTHWSFGKSFVSTERDYKRGAMGLAYEIVINSDPCIAYLMEENTMCMQALVIAHACYGHNAFFKGNHMFVEWTEADAIIDYLVFARKYMDECEERYGWEKVEQLLDSCHALMNYGVDQYKRPPKLSVAEEALRQKEREDHMQSQVNDLWDTTIPKKHDKEKENKKFPKEPQENLLYFFEKNAPNLKKWEREVIRIVRKLAQYFYPQRQTQLMNEGFATFTHYTIINKMFDEDLVDGGFMLEFLKSHCGVTAQPSFDDKYYSGINVYALGFAMYSDIKRICTEPTDEDREWFPWLVDTDWVDAIDFAMRNFKDESFVSQYLSPKVMRDFHLFGVVDDDKEDNIVIDDIHDEQGYKKVRKMLSEQYNLSNSLPQIQVEEVDIRGDRSLVLKHSVRNGRLLENKDTAIMLEHVRRLWGFDIDLISVDDNDSILDAFTTRDDGELELLDLDLTEIVKTVS